MATTSTKTLSQTSAHAWRRPFVALLQAALLSILGALPAGAEDAAPALVLSVSGTERLLFDHARDACEGWDIPDTPSRAYRDAKGEIHLFQTHHRNRVSVGPGFDRLRHSCAVVFSGRNGTDPASFDHLGWIASTHTTDGVTVHALVHNEFHGERAGLCKASEAMECWYNSLTAAVSQDGGRSFAPAEPRLVAALPFRADQTRGRHAGYFEPTNILGFENAFYVMANVVSPPPQSSGNCLLRSENPARPEAWRGWHDGAFGTRYADPYGAAPLAVEDQLCDPIDPAALPWPVTSLTLHAGTGTLIAVMKGRRTGADGVERTGVFYSTSRDLVHWEGPALLMEAPIAGDCAPARPIAYPALIDPESPDRNFGVVGDRALLTYVRSALDGCTLGQARDLALREVVIEVP